MPSTVIGEASVRVVADLDQFGASLRGINTAMGKMVDAVERAAEKIDSAFSENARQADAALESIGGAEAFNQVTRAGTTAAEGMAREFTENANQSDAALETIGGPDAFNQFTRSATSAAEGMTREFRENARQSSNAIGGIGTRARGGLGRIAGLIGGLGLGYLAAQATKFGVQTAGQLEMTEVGFEGLLGSAEDAKLMMDELVTFAATTPFELPGLANMSKNLLAMGGDFGVTKDNVLDYTTTIGDMGAVLGVGQAEMDRVVLALGQMSGAGKITGGDMNQLTQALPGFAAWKELADGMGLSVPELRKLSQQGKVLSEDAIPVLLEQMQKFPGAAGAMERASQTLTGVLSTFKDTAQIALAEGMKPLVEGLKATLTSPAILGALDTLATAFGETMSTIFDQIAPFLPQIMDAVSQIIGAFGEIAPVLTPLITAVLAIFDAVSPLIDVIVELVDVAMEPLMTIVEGLAPILKMLGGTIGRVLGQALIELTPLLETVAEVVVELARVLGPPIVRVIGAVGRIIDAILPVVVEFGQFLGEVLLEAADELAPIIDMLASALSDLAPLFGDIARLLLNALKPILPTIVSSFTEMMKAIMPLLPPLIEIINMILPPLVELLNLVLPPLTGLIAKFMQVNNVIRGVVIGALTSVVQWLANLIDKPGQIVAAFRTALDFLGRWAGNVVEWFSKLPGRVATAFASLVSKVGTVLANTFSGAWTRIRTWGTNVATWFRELPGRLYNAIKSVTQKIAQAFGEMATAVWERVRAWFTNLWNWFLGLPSRLYNAIRGVARQVATAFGEMATAVWEKVRSWWENLRAWFAEKPEQIANVIKGIPGKVAGVFGLIWGEVSGKLRTLWDNISGWFQDKVSRAGTIAKNIVNAIVSPFNSLIGAWNNLAFSTPEIKLPSFEGVKVAGKTIVPGWEGPTIGSKTFNFPDISKLPTFQFGGITDAPMIAQLHAREAVIPLTQPQRAADILREAGLLGAGGPLVSFPGATIQDATDADLVAQRTLAALRMRGVPA